MILVLNADVIINNAFIARKNPYLTTEELRDFCDILQEKLEEHGYIYTMMCISNKDIEELCDGSRFIKGIDKIHCLQPVTVEYLDAVMRKLSPNAVHALVETRKQFCESGVKIVNEKMSHERALGLLEQIVNHVTCASNTEESVRKLTAMGFWPDELVAYFGFSENDVRDVSDDDNE